MGLMWWFWLAPEPIVTALSLCHEAIPMVTGLIWAPAHRHKKTLGVNLGRLLLF